MRYLLITFFRKPGGQIDEQVTVSKRLKTSDLQMCNVILDFNKKKLEKCIIEGKVVDSDFQRMSEYYRKIYPSLVDQLEKNNTESAK
jgi:hypothetical protein